MKYDIIEDSTRDGLLDQVRTLHEQGGWVPQGAAQVVVNTYDIIEGTEESAGKFVASDLTWVQTVVLYETRPVPPQIFLEGLWPGEQGYDEAYDRHLAKEAKAKEDKK